MTIIKLWLLLNMAMAAWALRKGEGVSPEQVTPANGEYNDF